MPPVKRNVPLVNSLETTGIVALIDDLEPYSGYYIIKKVNLEPEMTGRRWASFPLLMSK